MQQQQQQQQPFAEALIGTPEQVEQLRAEQRQEDAEEDAEAIEEDAKDNAEAVPVTTGGIALLRASQHAVGLDLQIISIEEVGRIRRLKAVLSDGKDSHTVTLPRDLIKKDFSVPDLKYQVIRVGDYVHQIAATRSANYSDQLRAVDIEIRYAYLKGYGDRPKHVQPDEKTRDKWGNAIWGVQPSGPRDERTGERTYTRQEIKYNSERAAHGEEQKRLWNRTKAVNIPIDDKERAFLSTLYASLHSEHNTIKPIETFPMLSRLVDKLGDFDAFQVKLLANFPTRFQTEDAVNCCKSIERSMTVELKGLVTEKDVIIKNQERQLGQLRLQWDELKDTIAEIYTMRDTLKGSLVALVNDVRDQIKGEQNVPALEGAKQERNLTCDEVDELGILCKKGPFKNAETLTRHIVDHHPKVAGPTGSQQRKDLRRRIKIKCERDVAADSKSLELLGLAKPSTLGQSDYAKGLLVMPSAETKAESKESKESEEPAEPPSSSSSIQPEPAVPKKPFPIKRPRTDNIAASERRFKKLKTKA